MTRTPRCSSPTPAAPLRCGAHCPPRRGHPPGRRCPARSAGARCKSVANTYQWYLASGACPPRWRPASSGGSACGPSGGTRTTREILRLAVPAFGALVAEPLFLLADSAIVGRLGTVPLGGLGVASQALTTLVGISIFLAYGTTAAVARQLGAGHRQAAIRQGIDGLWLAALIGVVVLAIGWPLAGADRARVRRLAAGDRPGRHLPADQPARRARRCSLVLAGTGVLRGLQDTRTPLAVAVAANVVNVVLNAILVLGLHWGIAGSAWGTVIAQTAAAAAYLAMVAAGRPARRGDVRPRPRRPAGRRRHRGVPGGAHARAAGGADRGHRDRAPGRATRPSPRTRSRSGSGPCSPSRWTRSRSRARPSPGGTWAPGTWPAPGPPPTG